MLHLLSAWLERLFFFIPSLSWSAVFVACLFQIDGSVEGVTLRRGGKFRRRVASMHPFRPSRIRVFSPCIADLGRGRKGLDYFVAD